jgi:hypothetical protein
MFDLFGDAGQGSGPSASSSSRPTASSSVPLLPERQEPATDEGKLRDREGAPDMRRTTPLEQYNLATPRGQPNSAEPTGTLVQATSIPQEEISKLSEEHSGGDVKKRNGIARVLGQVPEILDSVALIFEQGDFRPFLDQVLEFLRYSAQVAQENPLDNDVTRGIMALFFTFQLYTRLERFKIETWTMLAAHTLGLLFTARVVEWTLQFMSMMLGSLALRSLVLDFYNRKFRQKAKEVVLTMGQEQSGDAILPLWESVEAIAKAVPEALKTWREGLSEILYDTVVKRAEQVLRTGAAITFVVGKQTVRMNVALARFIANDPFIMLGLAVRVYYREFVPYTKASRNGREPTIWNTLRTMRATTPR